MKVSKTTSKKQKTKNSKRSSNQTTKPFNKSQLIVPITLSVILLVLILSIIWQVFYKGIPSSPQLDLKTKYQTIKQAQLLPVASPSATPQPSPTTPPQSPETQPQLVGNVLNFPILMYHYVGNNPNPADHMRDSLSISPDKFDEQMKYLAENGYHTYSLDTFYAALHKQITLPEKSIALTFDDGYIDFYYNAYPILRKYNLTATVFVITGFTGRSAYLNWDQIKEMKSSGSIYFQAHTVNHYQLTALSDDAIRAEMKTSKEALQNELGMPINFIAYPYGATNGRVEQIARESGFLGGAGTWAQKLQTDGTIFNMPRLRVNGFVSLQTFISYL